MRGLGVHDFGFMPKRSFEEMTRSWEMLNRKDGVASSILERGQTRQEGERLFSVMRGREMRVNFIWLSEEREPFS
jgi:hypothetical protein